MQRNVTVLTIHKKAQQQIQRGKLLINRNGTTAKRMTSVLRNLPIMMERLQKHILLLNVNDLLWTHDIDSVYERIDMWLKSDECKQLQPVEQTEVKIGYYNEHELCCCNNPNGLKEMDDGKDFCSQCKKPF